MNCLHSHPFACEDFCTSQKLKWTPSSEILRRRTDFDAKTFEILRTINHAGKFCLHVCSMFLSQLFPHQRIHWPSSLSSDDAKCTDIVVKITGGKPYQSMGYGFYGRYIPGHTYVSEKHLLATGELLEVIIASSRSHCTYLLKC